MKTTANRTPTLAGWIAASLLACLASGEDQPTMPADQPEDQPVPVGATATFSITATGTDPLFYQWLFNSPANPVQHATNATWVVTNAQLDNAGFIIACTTPNSSYIVL